MLFQIERKKTSVAKAPTPGGTESKSKIMSPKRESMLNRNVFNRHALPDEVKEVVMPIAKISDFIHEGDSPTKRSSQLTNTGRQAMKKSRTEVTSPSATDKVT